MKIIFYLCLFSMIIGPLGMLPLGITAVNIYLIDVLAGSLFFFHFTRVQKTLKFVKTDAISLYFLGFTALCLISLLFSPINLSLTEKIISGLYLVRLVSYFSIYLTTKQLIKAKEISASSILKSLIITSLIIAVFGWLQYFLYPNLRNLYYLGWDPHFKRIFSTFLDPNYLGLILVLALIAIYGSWDKKRGNGLIFFASFIFMTLMFTYSRSSFLSITLAVIYLAIQKRKLKFAIFITLLIFFSAILLPRPKGGVGVQLERIFSIETRIGNWQQAFKIFTDHPILGIGFNATRYAKMQYNIPQDNLSSNHAGAGFDNSFLFVAATTGLLGLLSYLFFLRQVFRLSNLWVKASFVAIIIHSFFLNSLFFPWVMMWMWILLATGPAARVSQTPLQNRSTIRGAQGQ